MIIIGVKRKILLHLRHNNQLEFFHIKVFCTLRKYKKLQITLIEGKLLPVNLLPTENFSISNGRRLLKIGTDTTATQIEISLSLHRNNHFELKQSLVLKTTEYNQLIEFVKSLKIPTSDVKLSPSVTENLSENEP